MTPRNQANLRRCIAHEGQCRVCGSVSSLQAHHVVARRTTQDDSPDNLVCLCVHCHQAVHDHKLDLGPHLQPEEHGCAARLMGTTALAHRLLYPSEYRGTLLGEAA